MSSEIVGDPNKPVSIIVRGYDINNMPGIKKLELIESGEMDIDNFVTPPNMPGKKLRELRDRHRKVIEEQMEARDKTIGENPYNVGDVVEYKGYVTQVKAVDGNRITIQVLKNNEPKNLIVNFNKVKAG